MKSTLIILKKILILIQSLTEKDVKVHTDINFVKNEFIEVPIMIPLEHLIQKLLQILRSILIFISISVSLALVTLRLK